jgi:hypothetical protein
MLVLVADNSIKTYPNCQDADIALPALRGV